MDKESDLFLRLKVNCCCLYIFVDMIDPSEKEIVVINYPSACVKGACTGTYSFDTMIDGKPKYIFPTTFMSNGENRSYTCSVYWWKGGLKWVMDGPSCQALNTLNTIGVPKESWEWEVSSISTIEGNLLEAKVSFRLIIRC